MPCQIWNKVEQLYCTTLLLNKVNFPSANNH